MSRSGKVAVTEDALGAALNALQHAIQLGNEQAKMVLDGTRGAGILTSRTSTSPMLAELSAAQIALSSAAEILQAWNWFVVSVNALKKATAGGGGHREERVAAISGLKALFLVHKGNPTVQSWKQAADDFIDGLPASTEGGGKKRPYEEAAGNAAVRSESSDGGDSDSDDDWGSSVSSARVPSKVEAASRTLVESACTDARVSKRLKKFHKFLEETFGKSEEGGKRIDVAHKGIMKLSKLKGFTDFISEAGISSTGGFYTSTDTALFTVAADALRCALAVNAAE